MRADAGAGDRRRRARAGDRLGVPPSRPRRPPRVRARRRLGRRHRPRDSRVPRRRSSPAWPTSALAARSRASDRPPTWPGSSRRRAMPASWRHRSAFPDRVRIVRRRRRRDRLVAPSSIDRSWSSSTGSPAARASRCPTARQRRSRRSGRSTRTVPARGAPARPRVLAARPVRRGSTRWRFRSPRTTSASAKATPARTRAAWAPMPRHRCPYDADELLAEFVQPVLDHYAAAGTPYVGVLFAGLMLTADGPRLIEYNVRFGDPEAQTVLPLVETDLAELALLATQGKLDELPVIVRSQAALTVVAAAAGYPRCTGTGRTDHRRDGQRDHRRRRHDHAALRRRRRRRTASVAGGRVLAVTGVGFDLAEARAAAYDHIDRIHFDGMQVRRDIGWRALGAELTSYAAAGVDIDEGTRAVEEMKAPSKQPTATAYSRASARSAGCSRRRRSPTSTTRCWSHPPTGSARRSNWPPASAMVRGVGMDIVNHCIDDVLVQSAQAAVLPRLHRRLGARRRHGRRRRTRNGRRVPRPQAAHCSAARPPRCRASTSRVRSTSPARWSASPSAPSCSRAPTWPAGDVLIGIASSGPHTNGYSLLRKVFDWIPMDVTPDGFDRPLGETLLEPHRSYLDVLRPALESGRVKALAHITGGGLPENLPRVLPDRRRCRRSSWGRGRCRRCSDWRAS